MRCVWTLPCALSSGWWCADAVTLCKVETSWVDLWRRYCCWRRGSAAAFWYQALKVNCANGIEHSIDDSRWRLADLTFLVTSVVDWLLTRSRWLATRHHHLKWRLFIDLLDWHQLQAQRWYFIINDCDESMWKSGAFGMTLCSSFVTDSLSYRWLTDAVRTLKQPLHQATVLVGRRSNRWWSTQINLSVSRAEPPTNW